MVWIMDVIHSSSYGTLNRFVLPVLPIALMFSGYSLATIGKPDSSYGRTKDSIRIKTKCPSKKLLAVLFLLATNLPMAFYMSLVHQVLDLLH